MAQVNITQYAEITTGAGRPIRLGSKDVPSTITLTGTGEVYHMVYNDLPATDYRLIFDNQLTTIKFFAVKSSTEAMLAFISTTDESMSAIHLTAGVWQFFGEGTTTSSVASLPLRAGGAEVALYQIGIYNIAATAQDVEIVVVT